MAGGRNKQGPKHQNKTAFKIQFDPLALETHKKVSLRGLCKRCADQISWKMQYNKYKKMSEPSRCKICLQKNVLRSYMNACQPCSQSLKMCPKCLEGISQEQIQVRLNQQQQKKQDQENEKKMNDFIKTLKERSRRTVKRLYEKGSIQWNAEINNFVDEEGNPLNLQFRQGYNQGSQDNFEEDQEIGGDSENYSDEDEKSNKNQQSSSHDFQQKNNKKSQNADKKQQNEQSQENLQEDEDENGNEAENEDEDEEEIEDEQNEEQENKEDQNNLNKQLETGLNQADSDEENWQDIQSQEQDIK